MGLFDMSLLDGVTKVMDFSQRSLENTMGTIKEVHQTLAEIPLDVAQDLGMSKEQATALKETHRRILDHVHDGFIETCGTLNRYVVEQAKAVNQLADFQAKPDDSEATVVKLDGEKQRRKEAKAG